MNTDNSLSNRQIEIISGLLAGFSTTVITHPLDLIKIRLQLSPELVKKPFQSLYNIIGDINKEATKDFMNHRSNNLLHRTKLPFQIKQYYRGITPNLLGNISAWSLYFSLYAEFKGVIKSGSNTANYFVSSALAGISCTLLTNPIWVLKTRILGSSKSQVNAYKSLWDGVSSILKKEGVLSFWKGTIPSMFQVFQGSLQFTFYDKTKDYFIHRKYHTNSELNTFEFAIASAFSRITSMVIMYPSQVIKARLQDYNFNNEKRSITSIVQNVWKNEGHWRGFYKGIGANMLRVVPATSITFVVYESVKKYLR